MGMTRLGRVTLVTTLLSLPSLVGAQTHFTLRQVMSAPFAAELIAATRGLGYLLSDGRETSRPDLVIAAILLLAVLGKLSDSLLKHWETRALKWRDSYQGGEN